MRLTGIVTIGRTLGSPCPTPDDGHGVGHVRRLGASTGDLTQWSRPGTQGTWPTASCASCRVCTTGSAIPSATSGTPSRTCSASTESDKGWRSRRSFTPARPTGHCYPPPRPKSSEGLGGCSSETRIRSKSKRIHRQIPDTRRGTD